MVNQPNVVVTASMSTQIRLTDQRKVPLQSEEREQLIGTVREVQVQLRIKSGVHISLSGNLPTHEGLGSGTAIRLGAVESYLRLSGIESEKEQIQRLSKRGGASGVGLHGYFDGGMIFDLGIKETGQKQRPSSSVQNPKIPTLFLRSSMPNWPFALVKPRSLKGLTRDQERKFFSKTLPLTIEDTRHSLEVAALGIQAAVLDADYSAFCVAVEEMQKTNWKNSEWDLHPSDLRSLKSSLNGLGADCVALSSLGPTLVAFGKQTTLAKISSAHRVLDADITLALPSNDGRMIL